MIAIINEASDWASLSPSLSMRNDAGYYGEARHVAMESPGRAYWILHAITRPGWQLRGEPPLPANLYRDVPFALPAYDPIEAYSHPTHSRRLLARMLAYLGYAVFVAWDWRTEGDAANLEAAYHYWLKERYLSSPLDPQLPRPGPMVMLCSPGNSGRFA